MITLADCKQLAREMIDAEIFRRDPDARPVGWRPNHGPQEGVLHSPATETLYGGAAGGGKTSLLVNLARLHHRQSLLVRRTFPQLEDSLVLESKKWYGDIRQYHNSKHTWSLPGGRRVRMGHLERDDDMFQYQGAEFDFLGVDELTQINRVPYEYLLSRLRTTAKGQRVRVVCTSNPGGTGHAWVKERWAAWLDPRYGRPAVPGELRWFARDADGKEYETGEGHPDALSRTFIPALLQDNPFLGGEYRKRLALLPEPYRSQLLTGDWSAGEQDDAYQVVPTSWVRAAMTRGTIAAPIAPDVIGVDVAHGGDDQTVIVYRSGSQVYRIDRYPGRMTPDGQAVVALVSQAILNGGWAYLDAMPPSAIDIAQGLGMRVTGVNFGSGSDAKDKTGQFGFVNKRAELWWRIRELLSPESATPLSLPDDPELLADLTAPRWSLQIHGIKIEPKDDVKKRLGRSPDIGDALVLAMTGVNMGGPMEIFSAQPRESHSMLRGYWS